MDLSFFRKNLLVIIKQNKYSISSLSNISELSEDTLRSIIYGKSNDIKLSTLVKIADAFKVSIDELISRDLYSSEQYKILDGICMLPKHSLNLINSIIKLEQSISYSHKDNHTIPLLIPYGNLRDEMYYSGCEYETLNISQYPKELKNNVKFAVKISTNNLNPFCNINDILLIAKCCPNFFDIILYTDRTEKIYIRRYTKLGLEPINHLGNIILSNELKNYIPLGVVIKVIKEFNIEQYR